MCGVLTVGLTCTAPFVDSVAAQRILVATAASCYLAAAFAAWRRERDRADELSRQVASQGRLEIDFLVGKRGYEEERSGTSHNVIRTLSVKVANIGGAPVRQVRVYALGVDPNEGNLAEPIPLLGLAEDLNPGDFRFRKVSTYNEPGCNTAADTMATLHIPFRTGYPGERTIGRDLAYVVSLRATGAGASSPCDRKFRVWITADARLRMEPVGSLAMPDRLVRRSAARPRTEEA